MKIAFLVLVCAAVAMAECELCCGCEADGIEGGLLCANEREFYGCADTADECDGFACSTGTSCCQTVVGNPESYTCCSEDTVCRFCEGDECELDRACLDPKPTLEPTPEPDVDETLVCCLPDRDGVSQCDDTDANKCGGDAPFCCPVTGDLDGDYVCCREDSTATTGCNAGGDQNDPFRTDDNVCLGESPTKQPTKQPTPKPTRAPTVKGKKKSKNLFFLYALFNGYFN